MGQIKIISDGTIAGTEVQDADTGEKIQNVRGFQLKVGKKSDGTKVLECMLTVRQPILELDNLEGGIIAE